MEGVIGRKKSFASLNNRRFLLREGVIGERAKPDGLTVGFPII